MKASGPSVLLPRLLFAFGVDMNQSWLVWLRSFLLVRSPPYQGRWALSSQFPHVDFSRPRLGDVVRIPLQLLWLILVKPTTPKTYHIPLKLYCHNFSVQFMSWMQQIIPVSLQRCSISILNRTQHALQFNVKKLSADVEFVASHRLWDNLFIRYAAYLLAATLCILCLSTPFTPLQQLIFVVLLWGVAMLVRKLPGQLPTLLLMVLSVVLSTRYLWWRAFYTLNWGSTLDFVWGVLLLLAEVYTWTLLLLGYIQSSFPLNRQPVAMPADTTSWPVVDIYIPTYNEPIEVVKPTIYAAMGLDWPCDKLHIYLLDDGRREQFRSFAESVGIGYITRSDNRHAKAGNMNHALTQTDGEYVAIFDCDHIPTRSFLQTTMGWFLRDSKLALMQTPHHFYSPDPFEKNLGNFRTVPNEGDLFYGLIQDGNDLWNATFFCGSCAVIKREPLLEVGGIAVETVTEDAHTALKMQRLGYSTAYLNMVQAAGLATESLSAHIGQRIRWARGMAQIFRLDNPFFGKGLSWAQRVCYGNAMLHFFNGGPRLIFFTAPLAFLLFHAQVIYTPAIMVLLYVVPHIAHANLVNSRMQGKFRHSFWAEVYETVLSWYIVRPTTVALINPHKGNFNVTAKGGLVEKDYFDWQISLPFFVLMGLNFLGFGVGIARIVWGPGNEIMTTVLNLFWTSYNLILLGAAVAVSSEARQIRRSHRVRLHLPCILHLPDGKLIRCQTEDFSEGGAALVVSGSMPVLEKDGEVLVTLWRGDEEFCFPAFVTFSSDLKLSLRWNLTTKEQEVALVQCTFSRADAWLDWRKDRPHDKPLSSLRDVIATGVAGYGRLEKHSIPYLIPLLNKTSSLIKATKSLLPRAPDFPIAKGNL